MQIINPNREDLNKILEMLNNEFILKKGKYLHIKKRFPFLFSKNNWENLFLIKINNKIASFIAIKPVDIKYNSQILKAFFVGSVYTNPAFRGQGLASKLMRQIQNIYIKDLDYDLGVLWTNIHDFYVKLGWKLSFNDCLLESEFKYLNNYKMLSNCFEVKRVNKINEINEIDKFRISKIKNYIIRKKNEILWGYRTVYSPGEKSIILKCLNNEKKICGYMIGVENKENIYIYEILIEKKYDILIFIDKIKKITNSKKIYFNLPNSEILIKTYKNLFSKSIIKYPKITMFYNNNDNEFCNKFYIPFTDRI